MPASRLNSLNNDLKKFVFMLMAGVSLWPVAVHAQEARVSRYVPATYDSAPRPAPARGVMAVAEPVMPQSAATPATAVNVSNASSTSSGASPGEQPVDFAADSLEHDETGQIVTARGNVEMIQTGRKLTADMVQYDLQADKVTAIGNVVVHDPNGDVYTADRFDLTDDMKDGFIEKLYATMADGSRFWAKEGTRSGGEKTVMKDAVYTPCEPCKTNPDSNPPWQIRAGEVIHDKEDARVSYRNARFELFGVPVAYTPYFSHPDGTVDQKSGLLTPTMRFTSDLGFSYDQSYYWAIAPDKDATIGVRAFTAEMPMLTGEYRQRFESGAVEFSGGTTYSDRKDSSGGVINTIEDEWRGHLFTKAIYNIDDQWRAGINSQVVSDDQYARQYDISNEDVLENEAFLERFDGRDYAVVRTMAVQDIRVSSRQREQPMILPEVQAGFKGDPNALLGGRWSVDASALGLERDGSDQDMARGTLEAGWQRRDVLPVGLVSTLDLNTRGDAYNIRDRDVAAMGNRSSESNALRGFAQANWQTSMPFVKNITESGTQVVLEPIASVTAGTNVEIDDDIPNEDSQDIFLDAPKLFEANRFAGYDRIEDGTRVTYGMRTGLYGANGWNGRIFLGQSRSLDREAALFPEGSGLSERLSDYVGSIDVQAGEALNLNYRFQLDNEQLSSRRHELTANTNLGFANIGARYFYSTPLARTDLNEPREQGRLYASVPITDQWTAHGGLQYDFGEDQGMRYGYYGLTYTGQCYTIGATVERELTRNETGDNDTEIMLRIGLKNLGEFETSGLSIGGDDDDSDDDDDYDNKN